MPQKIRMWEVTEDNSLAEISSSEISLEQWLEGWLESDISMLDSNLMVIGRQVPTDYGGQVDLLCLDSEGVLVVVEIKKGRTPREVTAQALDYASWVKELSYQQIEELAQPYLNRSLEEAFRETFKEELPETLNESHRSLIVAEAMDASTERIVRYLSDSNVPINVATVQYFKASDGRGMLAQVYLVEPEVAAAKAESTSKKNPRLRVWQIQAIADENGIGALYSHLKTGASGILETYANSKNLGFRPLPSSGSHRPMLFDINPRESSVERGLKFRLVWSRLVKHVELSANQVKEVLPDNCEPLPSSDLGGATQEEIKNWEGYQGYFRTTAEIDRFLSELTRQK